MRIGFGEWGFRNIPLEQHFQIAQSFGIRTLEFGIGGGQPGRLPEEPSEKELAEVPALAEKYAIATPFCCLENDFTLPDAAGHAAMLEKTERQIHNAKTSGAKYIRLFAGFTPADEITPAIWQRMLDAFARCDAICSELGMEIAIETHGRIEPMDDGSLQHIHTVSTRRDFLKRLVDELPPRVGFNYDPGNLKPLADGDEFLRLDLINDRINYCHLKDWRQKGGRMGARGHRR